MTHRWLGLALYAEGESDHRFLDDLLRRVVEDALIGRGHAVLVSNMQRLVVDPTLESRAERIAEGCAQIQGAFHLLFVHADGAGDRGAAIADRAAPGMALALERVGERSRAAVAVAPIRETEAWALADYAALRTVLSTSQTPRALGLPADPRRLESVEDPKALFAEVVRLARGGRRSRRKPHTAPFLDLLGSRSAIPALAQLPAFSALLADVRRALDELQL